MFIYKIVCSASGDCYIGQTRFSVERRFRRHLYLSRRGSETHLHRAIRHYGEAAFSVQVLEEVSEAHLSERECAWIEILQPAYNMTTGGEGGDTSTSARYQAALAQRDQSGSRNPMWGRRGERHPNFGKKKTADQLLTQKKALTEAWRHDLNRRREFSERITGFEANPGAQKTAKPILFDGIIFRSVSEAVRVTGKNAYHIKKNGTFL